MKVDVIHQKAYNYGKRRLVNIQLEVTDCDRYDDVESLNRKLDNNKWMYKHLLEFFPFDYSYNLNLFADSLEATGRHMVEHDHFVGSIKQGRRALYGAYLLRTSYDESMYDDKALDYRRSTYEISWKPIGKGMSQMVTQYLKENAMGMDPEDYDIKMSNIAYKRCHAKDKSKRDFVWDYIKKYIGKWWC